MNRKQLEKYHNMTIRLKVLSVTVVTDSVKGSLPDYPYTSHAVTLHGVSTEEIKHLERKIAEINAYIDGITDARAKTLLDLHYRKHKRWSAIASDTGYSVDANEKYLQRFFKCP